MKFYYFYPIWKRDGRLRRDIPIHIRKDEEIDYLCGVSLAGPGYNTEHPKPELKLCDICEKERDRLRAGDPNREQVTTWWIGGLDDYRSRTK